MTKALPAAACLAGLVLLGWPRLAQPQGCPPGYVCVPPAYGQPYAPRYPSRTDRPPAAPPPVYSQPIPPAVPYQPGPWENSARSYQLGTQ